jgi:hypothetical protein
MRVGTQGAFSGRRRLSVSRPSKVEDAIAAIGDYAVGPGAEEKNVVRVALTGRLAATVQRRNRRRNAEARHQHRSYERVVNNIWLEASTPTSTSTQASEHGPIPLLRHGQLHQHSAECHASTEATT